MRGALPFLLLLLAPLLASCNDRPGTWSAYVYPDAKDQANWERTDHFKNQRSCERAARELVAKLPEPAKASYKCIVLQPI